MITRIISGSAAIGASVVMLTGGNSSASASPMAPMRTYSCLTQMTAIRQVSGEAGITIGSTLIPHGDHVYNLIWKVQLDFAGLPGLGFASAAIHSPRTNRAFVRDMTSKAYAILLGRTRCTGGLPLG
jgi:hypothetical protein